MRNDRRKAISKSRRGRFACGDELAGLVDRLLLLASPALALLAGFDVLLDLDDLFDQLVVVLVAFCGARYSQSSLSELIRAVF